MRTAPRDWTYHHQYIRPVSSAGRPRLLCGWRRTGRAGLLHSPAGHSDQITMAAPQFLMGVANQKNDAAAFSNRAGERLAIDLLARSEDGGLNTSFMGPRRGSSAGR